MKKTNWLKKTWTRILYSYAEQHDWILLFLYETNCLEKYLIICREDLYLRYLRDLAAMNNNPDRLHTIETDNNMVEICAYTETNSIPKLNGESSSME